MTVEDIIHPGGENTVHVPPKYASVATKTLTSPERYEWRRVLCAPGTGSIKTSADYASTTSTHTTTAHTASTHSSTSSYSAQTPSYSSSTTYSQPSHHSTYSGASHSSGRVVTGTGYYGGYNEKKPDYDYSGHTKRKQRRHR